MVAPDRGARVPVLLLLDPVFFARVGAASPAASAAGGGGAGSSTRASRTCELGRNFEFRSRGDQDLRGSWR